MSLFCGIDFGTSNSVITVVDGKGNTLFKKFEPSVLYFPEDRDSTARRFCGAEAVDRYLEDGMNGRFFQSVKSILPDPEFRFTRINGKPFTPPDLVAVVIRHLLSSATEALGEEIQSAVLGRPAFFSDKSSDDSLAQNRLEQAAGQAGLRDLRFQLEPIAAASAYEHNLTREQTVLVGDFGGGTSDFTVMRLVPGGRKAGTERKKDILAHHGVHVGGDDFDGRIMWHKLTPLFGNGSTYESWGKRLPIPVHIYHMISRWEHIHFLKTQRYRDELKYFRSGAEDREAVERLISLIEKDLGYWVIKSIEKAKIDLSSDQDTRISYSHPPVTIDTPLTRGEFENFINAQTAALEDGVQETLRQSGIDDGSIHAVFLTGGSSKVPVIHNLFTRRFGNSRVHLDADQFQSVSYGLALSARSS